MPPELQLRPEPTEELTPEQQAEREARDAEFERLVKEADAYTTSVQPTKPEEVGVVQSSRDEAVRLYRLALAARPDDPRNADVLYKIASFLISNANPALGEKSEPAEAREVFEELLAITDYETFDKYAYALVTLSHVYYRRGERKRALQLVRSVLMMPLPEVDTPPVYKNQKVNYISYLNREEKKYLFVEDAKGSAVENYDSWFCVQARLSDVERLEQLRWLRNNPLGRMGDEQVNTKIEQLNRKIEARGQQKKAD